MLNINIMAARINAFLALPKKQLELEDLFIKNMVNKIHRWHPLYIEELMYLIDSFDETENIHNIGVLHELVSAISQRVVRSDFNMGVADAIKSLSSLSRYHATDISAFGKIFTVIGAQFLRISIKDKVEIVTILGERGLCYKEVCNTVCKDLLTSKEMERNPDHFIEILAGLGQLNLESKDFAKGVYKRALMDVREGIRTVKQENFTRLGFGLAKCNAPRAELEIFLKLYSDSKIDFLKFSKQRLILYYYFEQMNMPFGTKEDFRELTDIADEFIMWGETKETLQEIQGKLEKLDLKSNILGESYGVKVPIEIPRINTVLIPKNKWTTTYDGLALKGEYVLITDILKRKGVDVHVIENKQSCFEALIQKEKEL